MPGPGYFWSNTQNNREALDAEYNTQIFNACETCITSQCMPIFLLNIFYLSKISSLEGVFKSCVFDDRKRRIRVDGR